MLTEQPFPHWRVVSDAELESIRDAALRLLHRCGFRILNESILSRLAERGFAVDFAAQRVNPTPQQMAQVEETARRKANAAPPELLLRRPLPVGWSVGHNYTCYYDDATGERRAATLNDIRRVVRAWHVLPEVVETGPCMTAQDVDPRIEPMVSAVETFKLTDKVRGCPEMMLGAQLPYLEALETIMQGREVRYHTNGCSVNHFTMDERACDCLLAVAKNGLENWWVNSCPIAGANAPVTLAGSALVGVAEIMGAWLAGWAINPDVALTAIPLAGIMDMRTSRVLFSTPESVLIDAVMYQYFHRLYGIRIGLCLGYTDAKVPGLQAINDKLLKGLGYGLFTDQLGQQRGILEAGNTYSPTQQVIDMELDRQTAQLARGLEVTGDTLALDDVAAYLSGDFSSFLLTEHTRNHWRNALWQPRLFDRTGWESAKAERAKEPQIVRAAYDRWRRAEAQYRPLERDPAQLREAECVLDHAVKTFNVKTFNL